MNYMMRRKDVERAVGLSRSSLYLAMSRGEFPRPLRIGKRAVGWPSGIIEAWIDSRIAVGAKA